MKSQTGFGNRIAMHRWTKIGVVVGAFLLATAFALSATTIICEW